MDYYSHGEAYENEQLSEATLKSGRGFPPNTKEGRKSYTKAMEWLRNVIGLSPLRIVFVSRLVHEGCVAHKATPGQVFHPSFSVFSCQYHSTAALRAHIYHMRDKQQDRWWLQLINIFSPHRHEQILHEVTFYVY